MAIQYPNGKSYPNGIQNNKIKKDKQSMTFGNRGMTLEEDINASNEAYNLRGVAVIHKKPTPVQIVQVDYPSRSAAVIKEAYFKQASTTDYNGIYRGYYIDFEAKETQSKTSFPLKNFHEHQINHLRNCVTHKGICFVIIRFTAFNQVFLLPASALFQFWDAQQNGGKKSISYQDIQKNALEISYGFSPRLPYLDAVDKLILQIEESSN
ncbi:Holliday junction resolvase RecU [Isobaculum melis]|uniref:Holliday junction resolvase RecU n=1 Tax=Isobaculum melis TaxID=142588 RepID=A0A1H9RWI2_9LACT|nr:Holliday junction resolvase RecU [Isobaculum melis]SER76994.1 recombination protein U [Isobaculum melis]